MAQSLGHYHQTKSWESACLETRRDLDKRRARIERFGLKPADRVLDLGCGDGLNISILAAMGIRKLSGIDISKSLLKIAQKNNPQAKFVLGEADKLPFKSGSFDVVLVDSVFHHLLVYDKALAEIKRVLKKGGALCFIEPHGSLIRSTMDLISTWPISAYLPVLHKRRWAYLGEKELMDHWKATENQFYDQLRKQHYKRRLHLIDFLSIVGKYETR